MKIGVIGTGNMGTILTQSLIDGLAAPPSDFIITNRTLSKAMELQNQYPDICVKQEVKAVAQEADLLFICLKPLDIEPLLEEIGSVLTSDQLLVTITSPVRVEQVESKVSCKVARWIPSIANRALSGASLLTFGSRCSEYDQRNLLTLAEKISWPITIDESITRVASDISSCGPAFYSYMMERMIKAAVSETEITEEQATALVENMAIGLGKLLEKKVYTLQTLKDKVHVKGGVTGVGLRSLEKDLDDVFEHLFQATHDKFREDHKYVDPQYESSET